MPPDHLLHIAAVVAVPLATPENGIDDLAFPNQMQGLESLDLFIGRVAPFPLQGLIVIHDHGVQRQHHHPHFLPPQAPEKQLLQHPAEGSGMEKWQRRGRTASWHAKRPFASPASRPRPGSPPPAAAHRNTSSAGSCRRRRSTPPAKTDSSPTPLSCSS